MRLIDADAVIELLESKQRKLCPLGLHGKRFVFDEDREWYDELDDLIDAVDAIHTVDAVPVVRCKDCWKAVAQNAYGEIACDFWGACVPADYYCADGRRKNGGDDA